MYNCVLICTYNRHFKYLYKFIQSLILHNKDPQYTDIYLSFDNVSQLNQFQKLYPNLKMYKFIKYISLDIILKDLFNEFSESINQVKVNCINDKRKTRNKWVAIKRSYSIIYLKKIGVDYTLCLDSDGMCVNKISFNEIFSEYDKSNFILVSDKHRLLKNKNRIKEINIQILKSFLRYDSKNSIHKKLAKCSVRQNDLWIINCSQFCKFINEIILKNRNSISKIMFICEFWYYELWLYYKKLIGELDIEIVNFKHIFPDYSITNYDFHGESSKLSKFVVDILVKKNEKDVYKNIDLLNQFYFNRCRIWRGEYYLNLKKINPILCNKLNITLLSSNYQ